MVDVVEYAKCLSTNHLSREERLMSPGYLTWLLQEYCNEVRTIIGKIRDKDFSNGLFERRFRQAQRLNRLLNRCIPFIVLVLEKNHEQALKNVDQHIFKTLHNWRCTTFLILNIANRIKLDKLSKDQYDGPGAKVCTSCSAFRKKNISPNQNIVSLRYPESYDECPICGGDLVLSKLPL